MFQTITPHHWSFVPGTRLRNHRVLRPRVRSHLGQDSVCLELEMPGVREADINIEINGLELSVEARRTADESEQGRNLLLERSQGSFQRQFELPWEIEEESVTATLKQGILTLVLPRSNRSKPRKIEVQAG